MKSLKDHLRAALTIYKDHFSAARTQTRPVAQTRFPPSSPGATSREKTQGFVHPDITLQSIGSSHSNSKCKPGSPNTMAQCMQSFKDRLRAALTIALAHGTNANRTRRTNEVPPMVARSHFMRENTTRFRAISIINT